MTPLAYAMRPQKLSDVIGQDHITGPDAILRRLIAAQNLTSIIFYGPPGTGKTSIANAIAHEINIPFASINATTAAKKDMQAIAEKGTKTILFIDEIHRFNKAQQDYLLPFVESGQIILIGATTENPYFSVNKALLSRSQIIELTPISKENILTLIDTAYKKLSASYNMIIDESAKNILADFANGDARIAINTAELSAMTTQMDSNGCIHITSEVICQCLGKPAIRYDPDGDEHYNTISAFIKSVRGSDPQAALYYMAIMLTAGEDPVFIARRLVIAASEDIGLADSNALNIATSAFTAVKNIGMPEARINLAHAVIYLATAPKSNTAYTAIDKALDFVKSHKPGTIPAHLKDSHYKGAKTLGHGIDYKYPHDYPCHYVPQEYMPEEYKNEKFYIPDSTNRTEKVIHEYMLFTDTQKNKNKG